LSIEKNIRVKNTETIIDSGTGEIVTTSKEFTIKTTTDEFFMMYVQSLSLLHNITSMTDMKVLAKMAGWVDWKTNNCYVSTSRRKELCEELKVKNQALSNSLTRLSASGMIAFVARGEYQVNPYLVWKGSSLDRDRYLKKYGAILTLRFKMDVSL
jgi:hypothetical protein